jgi:hypothetical protein
MHRIKLLGLTLIAIFTLGAIASTTAFAEETGNPLVLLPKGGTFPVTFEGTSEKATLEGTKSTNKIQCEKDKNKGTIDSPRLGKVEIDFEGCKEPTSKAKCTTPGDAAGTILVKLADIHLVDILPNKVLEPGLAVLLLENIKIECGILEVEVLKDAIKGLQFLGTVIGEIFKNAAKELLTSGAFIKAFTVIFDRELNAKKEPVPGEHKVKTCDLALEFCEEKTKKEFYKFLLLTSFGGVEELTSEETTETVTAFKGGATEIAIDF